MVKIKSKLYHINQVTQKSFAVYVDEAINYFKDKRLNEKNQ